MVVNGGDKVPRVIRGAIYAKVKVYEEDYNYLKKMAEVTGEYISELIRQILHEYCEFMRSAVGDLSGVKEVDALRFLKRSLFQVSDVLQLIAKEIKEGEDEV